MAALHIALVYPSDFDLDWLIHERVVVRFLAGICRHDDYHSHPLHLELIQQLGSNLHAFQLVHCAYECPTIMQFSKNVLHVTPLVSFDWYVTGYCISRFDKRWELTISDRRCTREENIDLLFKGLKSSSIINRNIHILQLLLHEDCTYQCMDVSAKLVVAAGIKLLNYGIMNTEELAISSTFIQSLAALILKITSLIRLEIAGHVSDSDLPVLTNIVQSHPTLEVLVVGVDGTLHSSTELAQLVVSAGNLKNLTISDGHDITGLLPHKIKSIKQLTIPTTCFKPLSALFPNATSLTYLEITGYVSNSDLAVLTNIVQSHPTLEVLVLNALEIIDSTTELVRLFVSASNLTKLTISGHDITELLPRNIKNVTKLTIPSTFFQPLAALALFPMATSLTYLEITGYVSNSVLPVLINIVQSHPTLEVLVLNALEIIDSSNELVRLVVSASNLSKLTIFGHDITELLPRNIKNVMKLTISSTFFQLLAALSSSATSLTYLEITGDVSDSDLPVLTNIVQSHPTLEVLDIREAFSLSHKNELQLSSLVEAAGNSQLKELRLLKHNYNRLPSHIREAHKQLLKPFGE